MREYLKIYWPKKLIILIKEEKPYSRNSTNSEQDKYNDNEKCTAHLNDCKPKTKHLGFEGVPIFSNVKIRVIFQRKIMEAKR